MRFTKTQRITMLALIGMGLFNPFTVAVAEQYFQWFYTGVFVLCVAWVCGFILYKALKPEQMKVPSKASKVKTRSGMKFELQ